MEQAGISKKFGLSFDKEGNIVQMSKKDVQIKLLESNMRQASLEDMVKVIQETSNVHTDQIKSCSKKISQHKSDTEIILDKKKGEIDNQVDFLRSEMYDIEDMLTRSSARHLQESMMNSSNVILSHEGFGNQTKDDYQTSQDKDFEKHNSQMTQT